MAEGAVDKTLERETGSAIAVLTTLPDVQSVSNVRLLRVVEVVVMKDRFTEATTKGRTFVMAIGSVHAAVITLLSVQNASNVKNLETDH